MSYYGDVTRLLKSREFAEHVNTLVTLAHTDQVAGSRGQVAPFQHRWFDVVEAFAAQPAGAAAAMAMLCSTVSSLVEGLSKVSDQQPHDILEAIAVANLEGAEGP